MRIADADEKWRAEWTREHFARFPAPGPDASPQELRELIEHLRGECHSLSAQVHVLEAAHGRTMSVLGRVSRSDMVGVQRQREATKKRLANMPVLPASAIERAIDALLDERPDLTDTEIADRVHPQFPHYKNVGSIINRVGKVRRRRRGVS